MLLCSVTFGNVPISMADDAAGARMETWKPDDCERAIESYPGYIGFYFDGSFQPEPILQPLEDFDFAQYGGLIGEHEQSGERRLNLTLPSGPLTHVIEEVDDWPQLLDQLPTVKVYEDEGPPDGGPLSGGAIVFFMADGFGEEEVRASIAALAFALRADLASLQAA